MLPKKYRITKTKEYENIFKNGFAVFSNMLVLKAVKNNLGFCRFGFIVSLKASKKAYQRAKIKRWLRESAREILKQNKNSGLDIAVIAKKGAFEAGFHNLNSQIHELFKKVSYRTDKNISKNNISGS